MTFRRVAAYCLVCIFLNLLFLVSCAGEDAFQRIKKSGKITLLTRNNAHCYYEYRDQPMGFEYDLAKAFSQYLGVSLRVITPEWEGLLDSLNRGKGDFVAASMTITPFRAKIVDFSDPYMQVQQKVVVHKDNHEVRKLEDLNGKTVHLRKGTSYEERLRELQKEGLDIRVKLYDDTPTEELINMVADGEIEITIADTNIARLNRRYYPDIRIGIPIEEPQQLGWAFKKGEKTLLKKANEFFRKIRKESTFGRIYERYYAGLDIFDYVDLKRYHARIKTRLPKYKELIQEAARKCGFDWRLIAAVVYQESHFDPKATSQTGVEGMMQLTQKTAEEMDVVNRCDPKQSIMGGVRYLKMLYDKYSDAKKPDRLYIALASFNVGRGHILDARSIARERGLDPNSWSALKSVLPDLRHPKYYTKTLYGYCRGTEPVRYVNRILIYYDILRRESLG
jgi:membrane-bound lytic murein transglycosylase F